MQTALINDTVNRKLQGKRVILASASPRRKEILEECLGWSDFEIIPSTFEENLDHDDFLDRAWEYPVETAAAKVCRALPDIHAARSVKCVLSS